MLGIQAKCPNMVKSPYPEFQPETIVCGYAGFEILTKGVFTQESGFDPLACKVRCRRCQQEYYIFPSINFKEVKE